MKKKKEGVRMYKVSRSWMVVAWMVLTGGFASANVAFLEEFANPHTNNRGLQTIGWRANVGAKAEDRSTSGKVSDGPILSGSSWLQANLFGGPWLAWTDKSAVAGIGDIGDVTHVSMKLNNAGEAEDLKIALKINNNWYVSGNVFNGSGWIIAGLDVRSSAWNSLAFVSGTTLAEGGAATLPESGTVQAVGVFTAGTELNNAVRIDDFTVEVVPGAVLGGVGLQAAEVLSGAGTGGVAFQILSSGPARHVEVFQKDGRFAAWPANGGMWVWGDEILVCYTEADHRDSTGHSYDPATAWSMFARSLDGGVTWTREDAHAQGITASGHDHRVHQGAPLRTLTEPIDFSHPDFAMLIHRRHMHKGDSFFYYTYDRGKSWEGPFNLPRLDTIGLIARTDYIIDGPREATVFLTVTKSDDREGRVAPFRTKDGGLTWERIAWIGEELPGANDFAIMPASVRLGPEKLLTVIRHRVGGARRADDRTWLTSFLSTDNGFTWQPLADPVSDNINNPPALIQLPDGRLVLTYIFRHRDADGSAVCAKISSDGGQSWGPEIVLREKEGTSGDAGYPRIVRRSDGKLVITYYWNHALNPDVPPYRYIAATIWDCR